MDLKNNIGRLVHHDLGSHPVHIIYRLKGSIPAKKIRLLLTERERLFNTPTTRGRPNNTELISKWTEAAFEELLHRTPVGPFYLEQPVIRQLVMDSWHWAVECHHLYLYALTIMGNHVHALVQSLNEEPLNLSKIMKSHKNFTALHANKLLGRSGQSFWERGYYDRDLRPNQFTTLMWYILNNPVKARLVEDWRAWPGTYLNPDYDSMFR